MQITITAILSILFISWATLSFSGEADVQGVEVSKNSDGSYNFHTTVFHNDTGWKHYANKWEILDEQGQILGTRILHHPHVNQQPFTRSLSRVKIPASVKRVNIRAHDLVHQYGGKTFKLDIP